MQIILLLTLLSSFLTLNQEYSPLPFTIEAEDCKGAEELITNITEKKIKGDFSGKGFIYLTFNTISFNFTIPEDNMYQITVKIAQILSENRLQTISINGIEYSYLVPYYDTWTDFDFGIHKFYKGVNNISFIPKYGFAYFDKITINKFIFPDLSKISNKLSDKKATKKTQKLMNYLVSIYGKKIISGQQEVFTEKNNKNYEKEFEYLYKITGKYPAIRGFDFLNYNPLYGWDDKTTERIINWVNKKNGIATASWHINIPKDFENYEIGNKVDLKSCTYVSQSNFKTENTIIKGTKENKYFNEAIKLLAEQLLKLQKENIPLIFRPLHGKGQFFWWGKNGAKTYIEIWKYLYKKLTIEYDIHNLIWVQNLYISSNDSLKWYSGDEWVDIIGYDKYNMEYKRHDGKINKPNLDAESEIFYNLVKMVNNKKMIAMTENDSIPSLNNLKFEKSGWLYFCSWYGEYILDKSINDPEDLKILYQSDYCVTLDELPILSVE